MTQPETFDRRPPFSLMVLGSRAAGAESLSGILQLLGCDLPRSAPGQEGAALSPEIAALNNKIMASTGREWSDLGPWGRAWQASPVYEGFLRDAEALLRAQFEEARMPLLWEPRLPLLASFWSEALRRCGYVPIYLHVHGAVRDMEPSTIDQAQATLPAEFGQLAWLREVLETEHATRGQLRAHVDSLRLAQDWRAELAALEQSLGFAFPRNTPKAGRQVDAALKDTRPANPASPPGKTSGAALHEAGWLQQAEAILSRWREQGEDPADHPTLDALHAEFQRAAALIDVFVEAARHKGVAALSPRQNGTETRGSDPDTEPAPALEASSKDSERLRTLEFRLEQRFEELASLSTLLFETETRCTALSQQLEDARQREQQVQQGIDAILSSTAWKLTSPLRRTIDFLRGRRTS